MKPPFIFISLDKTTDIVRTAAEWSNQDEFLDLVEAFCTTMVNNPKIEGLIFSVMAHFEDHKKEMVQKNN